MRLPKLCLLMPIVGMLALGGCASGGLFEKFDASADGAQKAVNHARQLNAAMIREADKQHSQGLMSLVEHGRYVELAKSNRAKIDDAQRLIDLGDWQSSQVLTNKLREAILFAQKEIHDRAEKAKGAK